MCLQLQVKGESEFIITLGFCITKKLWVRAGASIPRPKKTSVLPVALPQKVGTGGGIYFFVKYFYFQLLS